MKVLSATALLLDVRDLQERDRIVTFLTAEHGKKRGVARGSRTKFSRFAGQLQPLAKVEISWFEKDGRDLVSVSDVALKRHAHALQDDLEGILLGSYLAEHMTVFAQEDEPSTHLFRLLDTTIEALLAGVSPLLAARYFEVWVLRLAGVFPIPYMCPLCGEVLDGVSVLLDSEGALVCQRCAEGERGLSIAVVELEFLRRTGKESLQQMTARMPSLAGLQKIEQICRRVRRQFLQAELKSYHVMQKTLASLS